MQETAHFREMLRERGIRKEWVERTVHQPESTEDRDDGTRHYLRRISEFEGRWLRVVVNVTVEPAARVGVLRPPAEES